MEREARDEGTDGWQVCAVRSRATEEGVAGEEPWLPITRSDPNQQEIWPSMDNAPADADLAHLLLVALGRWHVERLFQESKTRSGGTPGADLARRPAVGEETFHRWRSNYGGLAPVEVRRLESFEEESARLRKVVAELVLDEQILQDVLS